MSSYGPDAALHVDWEGSVKSGPAYAIYFFKKTQYIRWNVDQERLFDGYPRPIGEGWPGLLEAAGGKTLHGAMHVPGWHDKIYFFFKDSDRLLAWDVPTNSPDEALQDIADIMPSSLTGDGRFAPLHVDSGEGQKVYAFRGDSYTRWTVRPGVLPDAEDEGYPRKIGDGWTGGLTIAPSCAVNVNWTTRSPALTNRKIYFFLGDLYSRWDVQSHSNNYRLDIPSGWKGWPEFE